VVSNKKDITFYIAVFVLLFATYFLARGLFDRKRVSGADEHYQNIQNELRNADEAYHGLENSIGGARSEVTAGIELSGTIGNGLDGIESLAVENTDLLGRAERILQNIGERKQQSQE
jgi:hypothetical protein